MKDLFKIFLFFSIALIFCVKGQVIETTSDLKINPNINTIRKRFMPPKGYIWVDEPKDSFGYYLSNYRLLPAGFLVRDFRKVPIEKQTNHVSILNIDVGDKDLQQCADAWIRLYAEFLWKQNRFEEIGFHFTSGQFISWKDYENGLRAYEKDEKVTFKKTAKPDNSYANFRNYLDLIFCYAGTISLDKECFLINSNSEMKTGDIIITPGSPGHTVIIVGVAQNGAGKKIVLLAESYMPAQEVHIIKNPNNQQISPWYDVMPNAEKLVTVKFVFNPVSVKRFLKLK